jgi:hypothetical protein
MLGLVLAIIALFFRPWAASWVGLIIVSVVLEIFFVIVGYIIGIFGDTEKRALLGLWRMIFKSSKYQDAEGQS